MPSRREAFEWVNKARKLWPPDINKILEYYKKAEELRPDYHIIYSDKARLFHGLGRFPEAVENYDLEIQKRRYDYEINKKSPPEKFETDEDREEFERGQSRMEEMFESMKQFGRDKAAQKIEPEAIYPWEDQILYFNVMDDMPHHGNDVMPKWEMKDGDPVLVEGEEGFEKQWKKILLNATKNCLEKLGHARKYYHALDGNNILYALSNEPELKKIIEQINLDINSAQEQYAKKIIEEEGTLTDEENEQMIVNRLDEIMKEADKIHTKILVNRSEEMALTVQKILERCLLKTDHEN